MKKLRGSFKSVLAGFATASLLIATACGGGGTSSTTVPAENKPAETAPKAETPAAGNYEPMTLKLGHQSPEATNAHQASLKLKELVEKKTDGKVKIEVYPFRQLGTDRELMESMQFGNLDLALINNAPITNFVPEFAVLDVPYLFGDWNHMDKFIQSDIYRELLKTSDTAGMKSFGMYSRGHRHVTSSKAPIANPDDFKGMRLRVIESPLYVSGYQALGANPQAMNWPDAFMSMQQGAIDGQENTIDIIHDENVFEVQKYVSKTGVNTAFGVIMGSKQKFDTWPAEVQQIIQESADEVVMEINKMNQEKEAEFEQKLKDKGMAFNEVDQAPFRELTKGVYDEYVKANGDKFVKPIEDLK
ncbi:TRAP transporter substrate-binding protein [Ammoniphilus sp. 3BR4]|uniref:TRAP transporter substrate-binding protein n=1 Tax=Ammoniphilus sp. 3BR4 TaxID=3158265 RepID=UPI003464FC30